MRILINIMLLIFSWQLVNAQESLGNAISGQGMYIPEEKTIFYRLAGKDISLKIQQYGKRNDLVFINLHDDEFTSVDAARNILETEGGMLIEVENDLQRIIKFQLGRYKYSVDPNRIFSRSGIEKSLSEFGRSSEKATDEVEKFGQRILQLIPENTLCIIALHNNTPDLFSANSYRNGNNRTIDAKKVYINPILDADDFFLTTDSDLYEKLANKGYNTILQDNKNCSEDGSLSVWCGRRNLRYVNCETEHGKTDQYYQMIRTLMDLLLKVNE